MNAETRWIMGVQAETEELKHQIEELSSRLSVVTAEKNSLQSRNSLLEKVVQVRGPPGDVPAAASQVRAASPHVPPAHWRPRMRMYWKSFTHAQQGMRRRCSRHRASSPSYCAPTRMRTRAHATTACHGVTCPDYRNTCTHSCLLVPAFMHSSA